MEEEMDRECVCGFMREIERERARETEKEREDVVTMMGTVGSGKKEEGRSCDECIAVDKPGTEGDVVVEGKTDEIIRKSVGGAAPKKTETAAMIEDWRSRYGSVARLESYITEVLSDEKNSQLLRSQRRVIPVLARLALLKDTAEDFVPAAALFGFESTLHAFLFCTIKPPTQP